MRQGGGDVFIRMCENVKQKTIKPLISKVVEVESQVFIARALTSFKPTLGA